MTDFIKRNMLTSIGLLLLCGILAFQACKTETQQPAADTTEEDVGITDSETTTQSFPMPDPSAFNPSTNFDFHQISWEYFLWLTSPVEGTDKLVFDTMYTDKAIQPEFKDDKNHILGGVNQAESNGIVVDKNGRAVYTTMAIDGVYRDFVLENKLYDAEALQNFPAKTPFPVGALSLKLAWKIVEDGEDVSGFYTKTAEIQLLEDVNGLVTIPDDPKTQKDVKVALVGFHIAIVVKDHPEAIWATFEQVNNAPFLAANAQGDGGVSELDYTFYDKDTKLADVNQNNAPILTLDAATQKLSPVTQVALQYRRGGGNSINQNNIDELNAMMHEKLDENSIWRNYIEIGAVWFKKGNALRPDWNPNTNQNALITGSIQLSNSVIETFTQHIRSQNECFSCHNTMATTNTPDGLPILGGKNVMTSHIILKNYLGQRVSRF